MECLTKRQKDIFSFIEHYIAEHEISPSYREIKSHFGFSSLGSVYKHLRCLKEKGHISMKKNCSRTAVPQTEHTGAELTVSIPFIGTIAAGLPIETFPEAETIALPKSLIPHAFSCFALRVQGDSMQEDHIIDGDIIVAKNETQPKVGQAIIALIDQEGATLKRFYPQGDNVRLEPANADYAPIIIRKEQLSIQGTVVALIRQFPSFF